MNINVVCTFMVMFIGVHCYGSSGQHFGSSENNNQNFPISSDSGYSRNDGMENVYGFQQEMNFVDNNMGENGYSMNNMNNNNNNNDNVFGRSNTGGYGGSSDSEFQFGTFSGNEIVGSKKGYGDTDQMRNQNGGYVSKSKTMLGSTQGSKGNRFSVGHGNNFASGKQSNNRGFSGKNFQNPNTQSFSFGKTGSGSNSYDNNQDRTSMEYGKTTQSSGFGFSNGGGFKSSSASTRFNSFGSHGSSGGNGMELTGHGMPIGNDGGYSGASRKTNEQDSGSYGSSGQNGGKTHGYTTNAAENVRNSGGFGSSRDSTSRGNGISSGSFGRMHGSKGSNGYGSTGGSNRMSSGGYKASKTSGENFGSFVSTTDSRGGSTGNSMMFRGNAIGSDRYATQRGSTSGANSRGSNRFGMPNVGNTMNFVGFESSGGFVGKSRSGNGAGSYGGSSDGDNRRSSGHGSARLNGNNFNQKNNEHNGYSVQTNNNNGAFSVYGQNNKQVEDFGQNGQQGQRRGYGDSSSQGQRGGYGDGDGSSQGQMPYEFYYDVSLPEDKHGSSAEWSVKQNNAESEYKIQQTHPYGAKSNTHNSLKNNH